MKLGMENLSLLFGLGIFVSKIFGSTVHFKLEEIQMEQLQKLQQTIKEIKPLNGGAQENAIKHLNQLTKPQGSLGQLEKIVIQLAGITSNYKPTITKKAIVVMCGDHGVVAEGVSAFPQEVTGLMMQNFVVGGAAINVLGRHAGAEVQVVDIGTVCTEPPEGVVVRKVKYGTENIAKGPAMTVDEAVAAIDVGVNIVKDLVAKGVNLVALGEMGIGNTTPSTAIASVLTGKGVADLTGFGTGITKEDLAKKIQVIEQAIEVNNPNSEDALDVLTKVGGMEIAGLCGVVIGAAAHGIAVVTDGVIATAGALVAYKLAPQVKGYLFASHLSMEPSHRVMLDEIGLKPMLDMEMRLGEGTGAALAFNIIEAATKIQKEMTTFADLGIPTS